MPVGEAGRFDDSGRVGRRLLLGARMPRRYGQAHDVAHRARVPIGHRTAQRRQLRGQYRLGGHDPVEPAQLAGMIALLDALEEVAVDEPTRESHADTNTGLRVLVLVDVDQVIEGTVEVRETQNRKNTGHRQLGGRDPCSFGCQ